MPPFGKCWSCGEKRFLYGAFLRKIGKEGLYFAMCCAECKAYFEAKAEGETNDEQGHVQQQIE